ncbi:hypothetical protein TNCV_979341 [Trichonephila clavipes]|nr:hypothetical protein TNCV_979341 [Trichonephila clavipes]
MFRPYLTLRHNIPHTHPPPHTHGQQLLSHYPHFSAAYRKTRSPLNSSLQKSFAMSRSKPRSSAHWSATARPIAIFHTSSMATKRKAMSLNRLLPDTELSVL